VIKVTDSLFFLCHNVPNIEKEDIMCIPHGATGTVSNGFVKESRPQKSIKRVSQSQFEKGDPNFVDERTKAYKPKEKKSFIASLFR
jgi:hypothetical protein